MQMNDEEKKAEGMPVIAQENQRKKPVIILIAVMLIIIYCGIFFHSKSIQKNEQSNNEVYAPQSQVNVAKNEEQSVQPQKTQMTPEMMQARIILLQEKQKELQQRLSAPLILINNKPEIKPEGDSKQANQSNDPNTQFLDQLSQQQANVVNATQMGSLGSVIAEGSLIHAVLESATDSDLPGYIRASVSEASFSEDGSQVLIPPGSRLIGQYKSGMLQGQSRIYIVWTRLITPEGISVNLGSPGVDDLGVAGMGADEVDRHFWQRFGTASLLSLIGAGAANNGVSTADQNNSAAVYRAAVASSFAQSASQSLQQEGLIAPTLKTYQGKPIIVFVAHDIHFEGVIKQNNSKVKIF